MTEWSKVFALLRTPDAPSVEQRIRFNPRPRGQVRPGSAADAVLRLLLRSTPGRKAVSFVPFSAQATPTDELAEGYQ